MGLKGRGKYFPISFKTLLKSKKKSYSKNIASAIHLSKQSVDFWYGSRVRWEFSMWWLRVSKKRSILQKFKAKVQCLISCRKIIKEWVFLASMIQICILS